MTFNTKIDFVIPAQAGIYAEQITWQIDIDASLRWMTLWGKYDI